MCGLRVFGRFLPNFCPGVEKVVEATCGMAMVDTDPHAGKGFKRRLELQLWLPAWDAYSLAGAILKQFPYQNAVLHKRVVLKEAMTAAATNRSELVGVLYDEIARHVQLYVVGLIVVDCMSYAGKSGMRSPHCWEMSSRLKSTWAFSRDQC